MGKIINASATIHIGGKQARRELAERKARLGKRKPDFPREELLRDIRQQMESTGMGVTRVIAILERRPKNAKKTTLWEAWKGR